MSSLASLVRRLSKVRQFNQGHRLDISDFNRKTFKNDFNKLVDMFQIRLYFIRNSPYRFYNSKYADEISLLQKELNFQQSRIIIRNLLFCSSVLIFSVLFLVEQQAIDWKEKFDIKFNNKAYGGLDDASGEGNVSIDD